MNGQIFQIHYDAHSRSKLDPAFIPYDNSGCTAPEERENYVFKHAVEPLMPFALDQVGFLSWKFFAKTGVEGSRVVSFLASSAPVDILLIDPFCEDSVLYRNPWYQSINHHPSLIGLARKIFAGAGFDPMVIDEIFARERVCYCNYFTANEQFWRRYLAFVRSLEAAITRLDAADTRIFNSRADNAIAANHYSFFFERCLSTYLQMHPDIKVAAIDVLDNPAQADRASRLREGQALRRQVDAAEGSRKEQLMEQLEQLRSRQYGAGKTTLLFNLKYKVRYFLEHHLSIRSGR